MVQEPNSLKESTIPAKNNETVIFLCPPCPAQCCYGTVFMYRPKDSRFSEHCVGEGVSVYDNESLNKVMATAYGWVERKWPCLSDFVFCPVTFWQDCSWLFAKRDRAEFVTSEPNQTTPISLARDLSGIGTCAAAYTSKPCPLDTWSSLPPLVSPSLYFFLSVWNAWIEYSHSGLE